MDDETMELLEQACNDSVIYCPDCDGAMEPDAPNCYDCGKPNPLREQGLI